MSNNVWIHVDRWMRALHLYSGLFLVPWMMVYALSAFGLNHNKAIVELLDIPAPKWEVLRELDFIPGDDFPSKPADQAVAILKKLDLDGPHNVNGRLLPQQLIVNRISGSGNYRIRWQRNKHLLVVERQTVFSLYRFIHFLHFRGGYVQPYFAHRAWAVVVDTVAISIGLWVVSGIYLWWRRPRKRLLGAVFLTAGIFTFAGLVTLLCL